MCMIQDKYKRRFHLNLPWSIAVPFQRGGNFESPCQILRCITDVWSPSLSERHSKWSNMSWSHECERRIIFENLLGTNAVNFRCVDTFQQLHTSSVPWGERQHRGEVDRHCLALFCWRKAHCCFQNRMIGHFFRNYIWIHSLHALQGCWLFRHRVCQKSRNWHFSQATGKKAEWDTMPKSIITSQA